MDKTKWIIFVVVVAAIFGGIIWVGKSCKAMAAPVKILSEQYKDKLTFIFRHMPLTNSHPNALAAATAAEAAGRQGKYWEMHDTLYENQDSWSNVPVDQRGAVFEGYANGIGLNIEQFKQDLTSKDIATKINRDKSTATQKFGVDSTPTFVLNGQVIKGQDAVKADVLATKVEEALKAAYGEKAVQKTDVKPPKE
jgi:protein-disulfide isomerase